MRRAVIYARVSSEDQERHGYSIPGQLRLARDYCARHGLTAAKADTFAETGSAKAADRPGFRQVLEHLRRRDSPRVLVLWDLDRATRNLHDFAALKDLWRGGVEIHLAAAGLVVTQEADPGIWMAIGHKAIAAEYEVERLSQRVKMGLGEKRKRGGWCHRAPLGYVNVGVGSRRGIEPDPGRAEAILGLFEAYAAGGLHLGDLVELAARSGLKSREGRRLDKQAIARLLRHPVLAGFVPEGRRNSRNGFRGSLLEGDHEPIIPRDLWWRVQEILDSRARRTEKAAPRTLFGGGLVRCAHCGAAVTGTIHKRRQGVYRYYACSRAIKGDGCDGYAGYVRESELIDQVAEALAGLELGDDIREQAKEQVRATWADLSRKTRDKASALRRRSEQLARLTDSMYEDKLLGKVSGADFDRRARAWDEERSRLDAEARALAESGRMSRDVLDRALQAVTRPAALWGSLGFSGRRELLRSVSLKLQLDGRALVIHWNEVFETVALAAGEDRRSVASGEPIEGRVIRLAREDGPSWNSALCEILSLTGPAWAEVADVA